MPSQPVWVKCKQASKQASTHARTHARTHTHTHTLIKAWFTAEKYTTLKEQFNRTLATGKVQRQNMDHRIKIPKEVKFTVMIMHTIDKTGISYMC